MQLKLFLNYEKALIAYKKESKANELMTSNTLKLAMSLSHFVVRIPRCTFIFVLAILKNDLLRMIRV